MAPSGACAALFRAPVALARAPKKRVVQGEAEKAIKRRLLRKPLVYTAHARERMAQRLIEEEDVAHLLREGAINKDLSQFGGKPSPVYALEGLSNSRFIRVVCASNENATVVVSVVDKES